jgi:hypothetical protein
MRYFLLTFNDDYGDEHNVPALECFTEEEYEKWSRTPAGAINKRYEEQLVKHEENVKAYQKYYYRVAGEELPKGPAPKYASPYDKPKRVRSYIHAYLGNNGDGFENGYSQYLTLGELVVDGTVTVTEVDKSFHTIFHKTRLSSLSLCNVFDIDEQDYEEDEEEEDEL